MGVLTEMCGYHSMLTHMPTTSWDLNKYYYLCQNNKYCYLCQNNKYYYLCQNKDNG